jgi:hypothetical protein
MCLDSKLNNVPDQRCSILFFKPWKPLFANTGVADAELLQEIGPKHILHDRSFRAVGVTVESDDYLFRLDDGTFAQVHLTYTPNPPETAPTIPSTRIFQTLADWMNAVMMPDHVDRFGL